MLQEGMSSKDTCFVVTCKNKAKSNLSIVHTTLYQWHGTIIVQGLREFSNSLDRENSKQLIELSQLLQSLNFIPTFEIHFEKAPSNLSDHDSFQPAQQKPAFLGK